MIGPTLVHPCAWIPLGAEQTTDPPAVGDLYADLHAVWRVDQVDNPSALRPADIPAWTAAGRPDPAQPQQWDGWPYIVHASWVDGHRHHAVKHHLRLRALRRIPARGTGQRTLWHRYPTGRWPRCSCCGEPMPCRTELFERRFAAQLAEP